MKAKKALMLVGSLVLAGSLGLTGCTSEGASSQVQTQPNQQGQPNQTAKTQGENQGGGTLAKVKQRGKVVVGVNNVLPGFGYLKPDGSNSGFDIDFAKAYAAAIFGDPNAVELRPVSTQERFTALQTGEIDILSRNATMTSSRDVSMGLKFGPTTFYDGQGVMVHADSKINNLKGLDGMRIGVEQGTTTEMNLTEQLKRVGAKANIVVFENQDAEVAAFEQGSIDAWSTDKSGLVARLASLKNPEGVKILPDVLSKEPLTPAVKAGDDQMFNLMRWTVYALIQAEEYGITQSNVESFLNSEDPEIRRFLGVEGDVGAQLGLPNDFVVKVIKAVGNYGEIFERNLGKNTIFKLDRGANDLWTKGGLLYSPPFR
ncbi:amino acid ABC transporter substrate-binding protein [Brevibacillus fluminis]|uniref:Amino acid ABC transporter substrate-binding protein n=1 Tax=Brevibacillus fluminis TaxID=511487 RepID=A0A3M8DDS6_9BACL|nr:amino acid ABC transporter substrate-binding protein [Brevibacillus fluminis]RNB85455.1 amino acid ABC transporter substrate-binding protein [Brevibacillus fluminis]